MTPLSIIIPTWKNIAFLDLCVKSIRKYSAALHEIIIFFNEFDSEAENWLKDNPVKYLQSPENIGICKAVNDAVKLASHDFICYMNDDMVVLPGWDVAFEPYLHIADKLWLAGTAIEPGKANPCYIGNRDYGSDPDNFREADLLRDCDSLRRPYNMVSTWTPSIIPKSNWEAVGGFDEDYFPGYGSDPDLAMKMWQFGCRHFIGVGTSLVYHFAKATTVRFDGPEVQIMDANAHFRKKWGIRRSRFLKKILQRDTVITPQFLEKMQRTK